MGSPVASTRTTARSLRGSLSSRLPVKARPSASATVSEGPALATW